MKRTTSTLIYFTALGLLLRTGLADGTATTTTGIDWTVATKTKCNDRISRPLYMGGCTSDYALVTASWIEDLLCIDSEHNFGPSATPPSSTDPSWQFFNTNFRISYQDIICNCPACQSIQGNGCFGGDYAQVLDYVVKNGVVGGADPSIVASAKIDVSPNPKTADLGKFTRCLDYFLKPCSLVFTQGKIAACAATYVQPEFNPYGSDCPLKCNYPKTSLQSGLRDTAANVNDTRSKTFITQTFYKQQKSQSFSSSGSITTWMQQMESDVKKYPLLTTMKIYEDIYLNNGVDVYIQRSGNSMGTFTVKIVGFGSDATTGLDYWLVSVPFGDAVGATTKAGIVKVLKGVNHCNIEDSYFYADKPDSAKFVTGLVSKLPAPKPPTPAPSSSSKTR